jgi:hypothetical protein
MRVAGTSADGESEDVSMYTSPALPWPTVLGLEALALIIEKPHLVRFFFQKLGNASSISGSGSSKQGSLSPNSRRMALHNGIFARMLQTLSFFVVSFSPSSANAWPSTEVLSAALGSKNSSRAMQNTPHKTVKALNMLHVDSVTTSPVVGSAQGLVLAIRSLVRVVDVLDELSESPLALRSPLKNTKKGGGLSDGPADGNSVMVGIVEVSWRPILSALSALLLHCEQEMLVQFALKAFQTFTNTCGLLGLESSRDCFLTSLCYHTFPSAIRSLIQAETEKSPPLKSLVVTDAYFILPHIEWEKISMLVNQVFDRAFTQHGSRSGLILSPKNIQALHCLFGIAHCLGSFLGSAWHVILATFEVLDYLTRDGGSTVNAGEETEIFKSTLRNLFESSRHLEDNAVIDLAAALTDLSKAALQVVEPELLLVDKTLQEHDSWSIEPEGGGANAVKIPSVQRSSSSSSNAAPSFALRHLCLTAKHNTARVKILWPLLSSHMLEICGSDSPPALRSFSIDSLIQLLISSLTFVDDAKEDRYCYFVCVLRWSLYHPPS